MTDQEVITDYMSGDLDFDEAVEALLKINPTMSAMEAETILENMEKQTIEGF